jgi:hypothetical protein
MPHFLLDFNDFIIHDAKSEQLRLLRNGAEKRLT